MGLVKRTRIGSGSAGVSAAVPAGNGATATPQPPRPPAPAPRLVTATERIAAATEELASGLAESAAATRELARSMEQIVAGAEEAAGAAQEQSGGIRRIVAALMAARGEADVSSRRTEAVATLLAETAGQIAVSVRAIERGAQRQTEAVALVTELDQRARDIGELTRTVSRISDQTNLLALNAAIEAARAGEQGRGFAVVADQVRTLAETSDHSAREVQELTAAIQQDVAGIGTSLRDAAQTALREAEVATALAQALRQQRADMARIAEGSRDILTAALESERAAGEAQKGIEQIAAGAEEQSSAVTQARAAVEEQARALDQGQKAAQELASLTDKLRGSRTRAASLEQVGASAEQLSASIQQMSGAAGEVMAAVNQISKAAQLQSSATQQTSAALAQIEASARRTQQHGSVAHERVQELDAALKSGRQAITGLIEGVATALQGTQSSVASIRRLQGVGRRIEKIVDAIALVAVQTSMLAVSGAVEAARAGEAGRGFAVVSNDIRVLAREATDNVDRARDTVRGILDQVVTLRAELEQTIGATETEVHNNRTVAAGLEKIEQDVLALGGASRSILDGADSILAAAAEMATAARQVATAAEEASAASREAATAATQQSRGVEDLAAAIEEIATLADELKHKG